MTVVRLAAARILLALESGTTTLSAEVESARREIEDARDRGLLLELVSGAVRWRQQLDAFIAGASRRSVREIDPGALAVLRLGVYQLKHLERIPAHAVVHESVEVARAIGSPRAAGFVNAVLRSVLRRGAALPLPARPPRGGSRDAQLRYLSITLSHPGWLAARWLDRYGFARTEQWCAFNNLPPAITVRPAGRLSAAELLARLLSAGIDASPGRYVEDAISLAPGQLGQVPPELRDELRVQDEGAQLVARLASARPGNRVLDACAAPGGKSLVCAHDMQLHPADAGIESTSASLLVAADYRPARVRMLAETIRLSSMPIPIVRLDARYPLPFQPAFDIVILDAPCSGLGTLRRDPDLKWSRQADELPALAAEARLMLEHAAGVVRPGGRLVYATCSSEPEENEAVVAAFLASGPGFAVVPPDTSAVGASPESPFLRTTPFEHGLDAFFAAVLVRNTAA